MGIGCPAGGAYPPPAGRPVPPMSDRTAHICVACGAQLTLQEPAAELHVGYVSLMPGAWGRFAGLPVRADAAAALQEMGVTVVRFGESYTSTRPMTWSRWRGPAWQRHSAQDAEWGPGGRPHAVMSGWGIFEIVDFAAALGAEPVLTLPANAESNASVLADLVEYCWGSPSRTTLGRLRASDGHPSPYNVTVFELGNEQVWRSDQGRNARVCASVQLWSPAHGPHLMTGPHLLVMTGRRRVSC